ncbi:MAG: SIS domain-containing protein [Halioglobus sp.]
MDYYDIIASKFHATLEAISLSVDNLADGIEAASRLMSDCLLQDGKIFACGNGADAALAQIFVSHLLSSYEHERPALPALLLSNDSATLGAIAGDSGVNDVYARQLRALGSAGDVLLCINSTGASANLAQAMQSAQQGNMGVVILSNALDDELPAQAGDSDVTLRFDPMQGATLLEMQLITLHSLCALVDHSLFGSYSTE